MAESGNSSNAGRIAFTYPDFSLYQLARFLIVAGLEMQSVAVGWQIYEITKRPLDLGLVGLAQFSPGILLFLVTGHAADTYNRRKLLMACYAGFGVCSALLLFYALSGLRTVLPMYGIVVLLGVVRSFNNPVSRSLLPQIIPEEHLQNAIAWNSSVNQGGTILGPSLGGLIYAVANGPAAVYTTSMLAAAGCGFPHVAGQTPHQAEAAGTAQPEIRACRAALHRENENYPGLDLAGPCSRYCWGARWRCLPVFAREVLRTGPWGLGLLRASPAIGAGSMALLLAHRPFRSRAGVTMLWCVAASACSPFSSEFPEAWSCPWWRSSWSVSMDMVSVVVRSTLVQLATPDEMRGRVSAVEMIFIGASNEIGQFESGLTAQWFGAVPAVIMGGIGTLIITALWAWNFPELRRVEKLSSLRP